MKKSNTNRPNTTINRGKIAAIAGLTLTCGMILSDVAPVMAASADQTVTVSKPDNTNNGKTANNPSTNTDQGSNEGSEGANQSENPQNGGNQISYKDTVLTINSKTLTKQDLTTFLSNNEKDKIKESATKIIIAETCSLTGDIENLFSGFSKLKEIQGLSKLKITEKTSMKGFFSNNAELKTSN